MSDAPVPPPAQSALPLAGDDPFFQKYSAQIMQTGLLANLRARGAKEIQVFVKANEDKSLRVQFRNKYTMDQWSMPSEEAATMVAALPAAITLDSLCTAIAAASGAVPLQGPNQPKGQVVVKPPVNATTTEKIP